jgi:serine/threonine-protein kinase
MRDGLPLRLRLALGRVATVGDERPTTGGLRRFDARLPGTAEGSKATHQVVLGALPPDGPAPASVARLAESIQALQHPHLVEVMAAGEFEGRAWVVEARLDAPTVAHRIQSRGVLSVREAIAALREIARALVALHRRGIVHGGIHPKMVHLVASGGAQLRTGSGEGAVLDDLHALGVLGWVMLTGSPPQGAVARWRPGIPQELRNLLESLVERDRTGFLRAEEVLAALDAFPATHVSPLDALFEGAGRGAREVERHPALLVVVLAALGVLFFVLRRPLP